MGKSGQGEGKWKENNGLAKGKCDERKGKGNKKSCELGDINYR